MKRMNALVITCTLSLLGACAPARPATTEPAVAPGPAGAHDHAAHGGQPEGTHGGPGKAHGAGNAHDHGASGGMMDGMCPMKVPGVAVGTSDVDGGASVAFTTATGDVNELRTRVRQMAEKHEPMSGMHQGGGGKAHAGHDHGAAAGPDQDAGKMHGCMMGKPGGMHAATMTVEDIDGGARLILKPKDGADLQALRAHVQKCGERMRSGECPMMGGHAKTAEAAPGAP
jgi:hypothetical protein